MHAACTSTFAAYVAGLAYLEHARGLCERGLPEGQEDLLPELLELQLSLWCAEDCCLQKCSE